MLIKNAFRYNNTNLSDWWVKQLSTLLERISDNVKNKRSDLGMSQEELAERIDKSSSFVGQLERGECSLKVETLQKLIHYLGLDANALLADDEIASSKINEICNLAHTMNSKKLDFLIDFARLLQQTDI